VATGGSATRFRPFFVRTAGRAANERDFRMGLEPAVARMRQTGIPDAGGPEAGLSAAPGHAINVGV